jgi:hypothetical protein
VLLQRLLGQFRRAAPAPAAALARERLVLVLMRSKIGRHLEVFREVMDVVAAGLDALGYECVLLQNEFAPEGRHIVFCSHLLRAEDAERVPASTILYNFEQLNPPVFDNVGTFLTHYAPRLTVWDYSLSNVAYLGARGCRVEHVPLGYAPALTRIERSRTQDIDVFFCGDQSERRARVLDALRAAGLNVVAVSDVYGNERDALIARAKVVLNVHNHLEVQALETPRVFYLLANRKAVVTELKEGVEIEEDLRHAMVGAPYERLVEACVQLVGDAGLRARLEDRGFRCMQARDESRILARALGASREARIA